MPVLAGTLGGTYATPLVNPPEALILALGRAVVLPRYATSIDPAQLHTYRQQQQHSGHAAWSQSSGAHDINMHAADGFNVMSPPPCLPPLVPRAVLPVSWGADHRVLDGAALAALHGSWKHLMEHPACMLLGLR